VAVSVTLVVLVTGVVATVNVALLVPAGTVTLAGTDTAVELSPSDTATPPPGAAALNVTVPVAEVPPTAVVGLTLNAESVAEAAASVTVSDANRIVPFSDALS
jgi:hypothetical protein